MTFSGEETRLRFHSLPTETQVFYTDWEASLARRGCRLHVDAVIAQGNISEVVIRIAENFNLSLRHPDDSGADHALGNVVDVTQPGPHKL